MPLLIKHVADLMGDSFRIPSYQRGYRWERKQIEQLLDDLLEYSENVERAKDKDVENQEWNEDNPEDSKKPTNNALKMGYYCLQPLAVTGSAGQYDIIDGQQRLTTIYLILSFLSKNHSQLPYDRSRTLDESIYKLSYQSRSDDFFINKSFATNPDAAASNIDFYFMAKGYETIREWFGTHAQADASIMELLLPSGYRINDETRNKRLHDVRFIWYDTPEESSISTFNNLNYGKIGLTASELVKALLFQCDVYESEYREVSKKEAFARSTKWSLMEEELQNEYFWGMLTNSKYDKDIHLELILDFVAKDIDSRLGYSQSEGWRENDSDWVFNIFSKAISDNGFTDAKSGIVIPQILARIEYLWEEIQKVYATLHNWYISRDLYHHIGLLVHLKTNYAKSDYLDVIRELFNQYRNGTKPNFDTYLKKEIGKFVSISLPIKETIVNEDGSVTEATRKRNLDEINYEEHPNAIRKILLLFNVAELLKIKSEEARFPFQIVDELKSLEHIHPQHLNEENIDYETFKEWYDTRREILKSSGAIANNENLSDAIATLDEKLLDKTLFNENKQELLTNLAVVDNHFDDLAHMSPDIMHSVCNMALVDEPTNSALGNRLLDAKRDILKKRRDVSYIPIGTWYAFNKHFSSDVTDLKFWSEPDRSAYYKEIEKVYNEYTK